MLRLDEPAGRWVVAAAVFGSGMASLDATVVNIALPALGRDLHAGFEGLQWTINGYTLTLAAFILLGGSLGDRFGRRRVFVIGTLWFAAASALCAVATSIETLVVARALEGIGGALLMPGSLAMIQASFAEQDRGKAIGLWSGFGGVASAVGPFLGGWLVAGPGWRWVFFINLPLAVLVILLAQRHVPESRDPHAAGRLDVPGATLGALGLAALTYGLTAASIGSIVLAVVAAAVFVILENRSRNPIVPPHIFGNAQFTAANVVTFLIYAALGGLFFFLVVDLQVVAGFSPILAGSALLPVTIIMLAFSAQAGALSARVGPRLPMSVGPLIAAAGVLLLLRLGPAAVYVTDVLPGMIVFGLGLSLIVAPLTTTVLAAAPSENAGIASGINNAVARAGGLLAIAVLPLVAGISGTAYEDASIFAAGFRTAVLVCAGLLVAGGIVSAITIRRRPVAAVASSRKRYCAIDAPPLQAVNDHLAVAHAARSASQV
jgi:EmrB/QacA subfamily drug resistance transporter